MLTSTASAASVDSDTYTPLSRVKARDTMTVVLRLVITCEANVNELKLIGNHLPESKCCAYSLSTELSNVTKSTFN